MIRESTFTTIFIGAVVILYQILARIYISIVNLIFGATNIPMTAGGCTNA